MLGAKHDYVIKHVIEFMYAKIRSSQPDYDLN
jgi:hypothetical protein